MKEYCVFAYPCDLLGLLSYSDCPVVVLAAGSWTLPTSVYWKPFLSCGSLIQNDCRSCQVDIKLPGITHKFPFESVLEVFLLVNLRSPRGSWVSLLYSCTCSFGEKRHFLFTAGFSTIKAWRPLWVLQIF